MLPLQRTITEQHSLKFEAVILKIDKYMEYVILFGM